MPRQKVFFVDDEPGVRKAVARTLEKLGVEVRCFASAAECLDRIPFQTCDLLITDVRMPGMDGIELVMQAKHLAPWLPVLVVTGYGDVPLAVRAMNAGAADFIEKPLHSQTLLKKVETILKQNAPRHPSAGRPLTKTELKVLTLVIQGNTNKQIARLLGRSVRTIEDHRLRIMRKLDVHNLVELVQRTIQMGLVQVPTCSNRSEDSRGSSDRPPGSSSSTAR